MQISVISYSNSTEEEKFLKSWRINGGRKKLSGGTEMEMSENVAGRG